MVAVGYRFLIVFINNAIFMKFMASMIKRFKSRDVLFCNGNSVLEREKAESRGK